MKTENLVCNAEIVSALEMSADDLNAVSGGKPFDFSFLGVYFVIGHGEMQVYNRNTKTWLTTD